MRLGRALILFGLCLWCSSFALRAAAGKQTPAPVTGYAGSAACQRCHGDIYSRWSRTRMSNVVRDPKAHPDAFIPDFSVAAPLLTFTKEDVAFIYCSKWKQRYVTKVGDDYFPLRAR